MTDEITRTHMSFLKKMSRYGIWFYHFTDADRIECHKHKDGSIEVRVQVCSRVNWERWVNLDHAWSSVKCEIDKYEEEHNNPI